MRAQVYSGLGVSKCDNYHTGCRSLGIWPSAFPLRGPLRVLGESLTNQVMRLGFFLTLLTNASSIGLRIVNSPSDWRPSQVPSRCLCHKVGSEVARSVGDIAFYQCGHDRIGVATRIALLGARRPCPSSSAKGAVKGASGPRSNPAYARSARLLAARRRCGR